MASSTTSIERRPFPWVRLLLGLAAFVLVGWGAGELWTSVVGTLESEAMRHLAEERVDTLVTMARVVTWAGSAYLLVPLAVICCLAFLRAGCPREALTVALGLGGAMLISDLVKLLTARARPAVEHLQAVTGSSFPSGHTTQAAAFWLSLALALGRVTASRRAARLAVVAALLITLVVGWSRVYLGVHYPSDVIAGFLLGGGWALYVSRLTRPPGGSGPPGR